MLKICLFGARKMKKKLKLAKDKQSFLNKMIDYLQHKTQSVCTVNSMMVSQKLVDVICVSQHFVVLVLII